MNQELVVKHGGLFTSWKAPAWSEPGPIKDALKSLGLSRLAPAHGAKAGTAMRAALSRLAESLNLLVRPLKRRTGYVLLREEKGEHGNTYEQLGLVRLDKKMDRYDLDGDFVRQRAQDIGLLFLGYHKKYTAAHLGEVCRKALSNPDLLNGFPVWGAKMFWLHESKEGAWKELVDALGVPGASIEGRFDCYLLRHHLDHDAVAMLAQAFRENCEKEAQELKDQVMQGGLGKSALKGREVAASVLLDKVSKYEGYLDKEFSDLKLLVNEVKTLAATARFSALAGTKKAQQEVFV